MFQILAESIISDASTTVKRSSLEVLEASCLKFLNNRFSDQEDAKAELLRSQSDKFDYRLIKLENGIRVLFISDPSYKDLVSKEDVCDKEYSDSKVPTSTSKYEKMSALVVAVNVGSFADPEDVPGLAHMLEHMMSMGSTTFPEENALDQFLSSHGGFQNARTECEYTLYQIEVHRRYLKEAMEMFGAAFVSPLFRPESIEREIVPVDTEFVEASTYDCYRAQLLLSHIATRSHPLSKFCWGNRKSLITEPTAKGLDIRKNLIDFFTVHYRPENIVVVVQSQEALANLQQWTVDVFSKVENRPASSNKVPSTVCPFDHRFNRLYLMHSSCGPQLYVHWCLPPVLDQYLFGPFEYLCDLIGRQGNESLIAELRRRDLAIDLVTDSDYFAFKINSLLSIFRINFFLTDGGARRLDEVMALLFEYLAVIRKAGAQEYFFREIQATALKSFNLKSDENPLAYSTDLATNLLYYPFDHLLAGHRLYYHFNNRAVEDLLDRFVLSNANFILITSAFQSGLPIHKEPWMQTQFQELPVPTNWIEHAKKCTGDSKYFRYPKANPFIATKFELLRDILPETAPERLPTEYPVKIKDSARLIVWHKTDLKFHLPKASIHLHLLSPCLSAFSDTLANVTLADVIFYYVLISLRADISNALAAELTCEFSSTYYGIEISIAGFNDKLPELVILVLKHFKNIQFESTFLKLIKEEVIKHYFTEQYSAESYTTHLRMAILVDRFYLFLDRWTEIESIEKEQMVEYRQRLFASLSIEMLVQGNMTIAETQELSKQIDDVLCLSQDLPAVLSVRQKIPIAQIPLGIHKLRTLTQNEQNAISHIVCYYQLGPFTFTSHCYLTLFIEVIQELCFKTLRTKEGLGYNVGCSAQDTFGILGFSIAVSSRADKFSCTYVEGRIAEFIDKVSKKFVMQMLNEKQFKEFVASAIKHHEVPDVSLEEEVRRNMDEINTFDYCFDRLKREIDQLRRATLKGLKKWATQHIFVPPNKRCQLTIQVVGNGVKSLEESLTWNQLPATELMIKRTSQLRSLQLFHAKADPNQFFILDIPTFKKQLQPYSRQVPAKDL